MTNTATPQVTTPPILVLENFLTREEHEALIAHARANRNNLVASGVLNEKVEGGVDHDVRKSSVGHATDTITAPFAERLNALLPHVRKEVGVGWFPLGSIETQFTAHGDGDFFAIHTDDGSVATYSRKLTFVYYFHIPPRGFEGGELVIYDWEVSGRFIGPGAVAHTIEPADNTIVFFPSNAFHEVKPVRCPGNDPDDFRFTVNGWFHTDLTAADVELVDRLTDAQRLVLPKLTNTGFEVIDTSADLTERLTQSWRASTTPPSPEVGDRRIYPQGTPTQTPIDLDPHALLDELLAEHEAWAGTPLQPTAVFGYRTFHDGQTERPHTLRAESHVVSSLHCLAVDNHTGSWPLYLVDHDGTEHEIDLQPGQCLRYESASCAVGHQTPLEGGTATYLMVHYRPTEWEWTEAKVWDALVAHHEALQTNDTAG